MQAADLRVSIKGSATVKNEVREGKDGGLEVIYAAPMSGEYRISISMGPTPVPGSPFRCTFEVYLIVYCHIRIGQKDGGMKSQLCSAHVRPGPDWHQHWTHACQARLSGTIPSLLHIPTSELNQGCGLEGKPYSMYVWRGQDSVSVDTRLFQAPPSDECSVRGDAYPNIRADPWMGPWTSAMLHLCLACT